MRALLRSIPSFLTTHRPHLTMDPLIAVIGATGTGKSKLAVDLATRFNGEIINGDAMQMYRGLPIITNQIPPAERNGIPHHLISCIDLDEEAWRVGLFKNECLRIISAIRARGKVPVLVGGTHYYTQAVLFRDQLVGEVSGSGSGSGDRDVEDKDKEKEKEQEDEGDPRVPSKKWPILDAPTEVVLQKLREVDPVMADRWHPNENRKIRRSLEIYFQTGRPASEVYAEQKRMREEGSRVDEDGAGQLRFPTVIFWVHAEKETLNARLEKRVDGMLEQGLLDEAQRMYDYIREKKAQGVTVDQTRGVWISIGFKELAPYLDALAEGKLSERELETLKKSCLEAVNVATRQYATSQVKWIRNKLWRALAETAQTQRLYLLDSTDVQNWDRCIKEPSEMLVRSLLEGEPAPDPKSLSDLARTTLGAKESQPQNDDDDSLTKTVVCDVCRRTLANKKQWDIHVNGVGHKKAVKGAAKRAEREKFLREREGPVRTQNSNKLDSGDIEVNFPNEML